MIKLKNQIFNVLKLLLIVHILISSGAALYGQITGSKIDPIKAILKFQTQPQNTTNETPVKDVEYYGVAEIQIHYQGSGDWKDLR